MGERQFRVVVCEDEPLLLANLKKKIDGLSHDFEVVATAEDGNAAAEILVDTLVDVLVTDIRMPGLDGLDLIKLASDRHPHIVAVVISGHGEFEYAQRAIRYGVVDYLLKPVTTSQLEETFTKIRSKLQRTESLLAEVTSHPGLDRFHSQKAVASMIQDYIRDNYMRVINVQSMAEQFHIDASYLCRVFSKYTGVPPTRYISAIRIDAAKSLIANNPSLLLRDVGELVGYTDQFYFSRVFKQIVGKSPESFRASLAGL